MCLVIHYGLLFNTRRERVGTTLTQRREERGERNHPEPGVTYQTGRITYFSPGLIKISALTQRGRKMRGGARKVKVLMEN